MQEELRATGNGIMYTLEKWCEANNFDLQGKSFIIQGLGNVGYYIAEKLQENGMNGWCW